MTKVSVIIPAFNAGKYLSEAIDSVLNQTYKDEIEILVVDDGSTDNTWDIINSYGDKIYGFRHPKNLGIASAINTGLMYFTGDVFCWLSADDLWEPNKLEEQLKIWNDYPESIIYSAYTNISVGGFIFNHQGINVADDYFGQASIRGCFMNFSTAWIPKTILDKVGYFNEDFKFYEDYEWLIRAALIHKVDFRFIDKSLVNRRIHFKQVTLTCDKKIAEEYNHKIRKLIYEYISGINNG